MEKRCVRDGLVNVRCITGASMSATLNFVLAISADSWKPYWRDCTQTHERGGQTAQRAARAGVVGWLLASIAAARCELVRTGQPECFLNAG